MKVRQSPYGLIRSVYFTYRSNVKYAHRPGWKLELREGRMALGRIKEGIKYVDEMSPNKLAGTSLLIIILERVMVILIITSYRRIVALLSESSVVSDSYFSVPSECSLHSDGTLNSQAPSWNETL
ncbi:hypothetical protein HNY73_005064 [Argiope bruennichi]|uniref:Uncharacterized protein n=1 Tax=Argiope bruennichi TaxID=94029 RepID=A0A8T0FMG6_ARGBR|nr:hypothetical protein HNY73_005064 [Argiope bruennichi]